VSQLVLDGTGTPTPPGVALTRRQRFALEIVAEKEPISSERLGAYLHELRAVEESGNGHGHEDVCRFCRQEGRGMGERLRELDLVRYSTKAHGWRLATSDVRRLLGPGAAYDPDTAEIPF
jgi:hypothetical protein